MNENEAIKQDKPGSVSIPVNAIVIQQFIIQQKTLDDWYDLKPIWNNIQMAKEHKEECEFHVSGQSFRIIERLIIERVAV